MNREEILSIINDILLDDDKGTVTEENQLKDVIFESLDYAVFFLDLNEHFENLNEQVIIKGNSHLSNIYVHELITEIQKTIG